MFISRVYVCAKVCFFFILIFFSIILFYHRHTFIYFKLNFQVMFRLNCINSQKWSNIIYFMVYHLQPIFMLMFAYYDIVSCLLRRHTHIQNVNKCNEMHKMCHTFCASVIFCVYIDTHKFVADGSIFPMRNWYTLILLCVCLNRYTNVMWCEEKRKLNLNFSLKAWKPNDKDNKIFELIIR